MSAAHADPIPISSQELDLTTASVELLAAEALVQERNYSAGHPVPNSAGLELFRRAIDGGDEEAWAATIGLYRGLLVAYASRIVIRRLVREDDAFCVDRAFERFWRATRRTGLAQFSDLGSILKYLKLCLASVLLDEARARRRSLAVSLDSVEPDARLSEDPAEAATAQTASSELWKTIEGELKTDRERLVARLSFASGLTPRQIYARHSGRFSEINEVYRIKRNIVERLRHSAAIRDLRG